VTRRRPRQNDRGSALLTAILIVVLLAALAPVATVGPRIETLVSGHFRQAQESLHIAEGAAALVTHDLAAIADWTSVLSTGATAAFADGSPTGPRVLPGGDTVTLCCGPGSLSDGVQQRAYGGVDWGADTPVWRLFAWGPAASWLPAGRIDGRSYVAVWIADDPHDGDGDPWRDSNRTLALHAQAFAAGGGRRVVETLLWRPMNIATGTPSAGVRNVFWREIRW
jgi:hypothetical protein